MMKSWIFAAALGLVTFGSSASAATIAVGYSYSLINAFVQEISMPSFASVADPDGFILTLNGNDYGVASSGTFDVLATTGLSNVSSFTITGIDTSLALDPSNTLAFPIGILFSGITGSVSVGVTPITFTVPAPVPLPAALPLFAVTLAALGGLSARRRRQQV